MRTNEKYFAELEFSDSAQMHFEYSPFGKIYFQSGTYADENPIMFSSEYFDIETALVYYNYRYYSPELGRWLSRDPIEEDGGMNLYGMVGNDTVNRLDLLGLKCSEFCSRLKRRITTIQGSIKTEIQNERNAAEAAISLNAWQTGTAYVAIIAAGGNAIKCLYVASTRATAAASSIAAKGSKTILNAVRNVSTGRTIAQEIAISTGRTVYVSTATRLIASDMLQDYAIDKTAETLMSENSLVNRSNIDMLLDAIAGGDRTANELIKMAEKASRNANNLSRYLADLQKIYNKCCK